MKILYSPKGLYVLMDAADAKVSVTTKEDFDNLWLEDVFEFFLWPDERDPVYFEYEISPLGRELPILVPNLGGTFLGWRPWHYDGARKTKKATSAVGGTLAAGGAIAGWKAEVFVPYELLAPLRNVPPRAGTRWRANFYRMDYDHGNATGWDWSQGRPQLPRLRPVRDAGVRVRIDPVPSRPDTHREIRPSPTGRRCPKGGWGRSVGP